MKYNLAHRGLSGIAPENTRIAFQEAVNFKFDGVEFDVHLSKDNKIVIIHDEKINRTSDGRGIVKDMTLKELRTFNFAKKFRGIKNQQIMTLEEFLKEFSDSFKIINIELKTDVYDYPNIESKVLNAISKYPKEKFILSSFNFNTLKRIRDLDDSIQIGFLWKWHMNFKEIPKREIKRVCTYLHPSYKLFSSLARKVKYDSLKLKYVVWTIDSRKAFRKAMKAKKVHSVISEYKYNKVEKNSLKGN